ncbi:Uu.00g069980.m01.CDS01 [Anthostomella pinea]|uniref:Uu.00g069980.m01.CDS01 n=1 Tax=Anthostomella pinea TaxID=933095 RepID=A0AAI8YNL0_9PEZI|nr:Uu.00g069980.m01.CDS01 [Anthostomella pinea]
MAILEDVPGLEVTVRVAGADLPEHDDPHGQEIESAAANSAPAVCKYLECADDAEFHVHIRVHPDYEWGYRNHSLVARTYVDGKRIRGEVMRAVDTQYVPAVRNVLGQEVYSNLSGLWSLRRFKFAVVDTVDEAQKERVASDLKIAKDLGVIEVRFSRIIEFGPSQHYSTNDPKSGGFELTEKSLKGKAISHGTSYTAAERVSHPNFIDARDLVEDAGPIAVFRFLYRSREALKREIIIPRSPTRSPTLETLSPAERDRLARERLDQLRNKVKNEPGRSSFIKREYGEVFDLTDDATPLRPAKLSRLQSGREVIDLTDD